MSKISVTYCTQTKVSVGVVVWYTVHSSKGKAPEAGRVRSMETMTMQAEVEVELAKAIASIEEDANRQRAYALKGVTERPEHTSAYVEALVVASAVLKAVEGIREVQDQNEVGLDEAVEFWIKQTRPEARRKKELLDGPSESVGGAAAMTENNQVLKMAYILEDVIEQVTN